MALSFELLILLFLTVYIVGIQFEFSYWEVLQAINLWKNRCNHINTQLTLTKEYPLSLPARNVGEKSAGCETQGQKAAPWLRFCITGPRFFTHFRWHFRLRPGPRKL